MVTSSECFEAQRTLALPEYWFEASRIVGGVQTDGSVYGVCTVAVNRIGSDNIKTMVKLMIRPPTFKTQYSHKFASIILEKTLL